ncbi:uncharacterized protein TNCV_1271861 [Trichonephila clavipes]|nr:uncharacterized protein TNCV_1271861 [Trichonephila clavipes]
MCCVCVIPYLIGALPNDVISIITSEPEEKCRDYSHIRGMLLQRFKLTAEKLRELFSRKDYYFEIRAYFEVQLNELKIDSFDGLKNLVIADKMKNICFPECKEHCLDIWEKLSHQKCCQKNWKRVTTSGVPYPLNLGDMWRQVKP